MTPKTRARENNNLRAHVRYAFRPRCSSPVKIGISADAPGVLSAIAHLSRPELPGPAASIPVTIVVPHDFAAENAFSWSGKVMLGRPAGRRNLFFRVPEGVKAFTLSIHAPRKDLSAQLIPPHDANALPHMLKSAAVSGESKATVEAPVPGVWELVLHDMRDSLEFDWGVADQEYLPSTAIEVSAKIVGASALVQGQELRMENKFAAFDGAITSIGLGGLRSSRATLLPRHPLVYDIDVEEGQEMLVAEIGRSGGAELDADLHLFDCTRGTCAISRRGDKRGAQERVVVERPAPGKWKVVVLASGAGQGAMELAYTDYYTHPKLGTLSTTDAPQKRKPGEIWQAKLNVWRAGEPRQGYKPAGVIRVLDQSLRLQQMDAHAPAFSAPVPGRAAYVELKSFLLDNESAPAVAGRSGRDRELQPPSAQPSAF